MLGDCWPCRSELPTSGCVVHDRSAWLDNFTNDSVQTPLPYVFCVHLKQVVSLYLFILPFTLVDAMGWKMVFIMFCISMTFMGVEGIAAMIEQPFGT